MIAIVTQGDARHLLLPDASVDLIVTSPPFLNLRSYTDGGAHMDDQIGVGSRDEYLAQLWEATAEMKRVLKPSGSLFIELGDSYTDKCLNMTPHRYAIGCVDRLGLYKRAEIVWSRPNGLPESVTDRVRRSHSVVFHFVTQPRYYAAADEVREPHAPGTAARYAQGYGKDTTSAGKGRLSGPDYSGVLTANPLGKLPGSVWTIPTAPLMVPEDLGVDHFAAMPPELAKRIVAGWSPREVCTACGEGRRPVVRPTGNYVASSGSPELGGEGVRYAAHHAGTRQPIRTATGWSLPKRELVRDGTACACPDATAPTTLGVILDPFGGTGTTALVASVLGRVGISVDLSADYCRLARWRTSDPGERARALGMPKPPPQVDGQLGMFDGLGA